MRGCGVRQAGGIYLSVATSPFGKPLDHFLIDPPAAIDAMSIGLTPVGVRGVVDGAGVYHVLDWVGSEGYPKVYDFIAEARVKGISRRAEGSGIDYSQITPKSRLVLAHSRAGIGNPGDVSCALADEGRTWRCPKHADAAIFSRHSPLSATGAKRPFITEACLGLHQHDFAASELTDVVGVSGIRHVGDLPYQAYVRPETQLPKYTLAVFAQLPIGGIEVVRDPADPDREKRQVEKASAARISVALVED